MRALVLAACLLVLLSGCFGGGTDDAPDDHAGPTVTGAPVAADGEPATAIDLAPGCSLDRLAVVHHAGGRAATPAGPVPVGCLMHTGVDSAEPTIGIASDGTVFHYPAAVVDRDLPGTPAVRFLTGVSVSYNEGEDWRVLLPTAGPTVPTHQVSLDPYLYLDPTTDRLFADDLFSPNCSVLSISDDLGQTWTNTAGGCSETDHQTIFAGPPVTSMTVGYPNILYRCSINYVALDGSSTASTCTKSLDGGLTSVPTGEPLYVTRAEDLPDVCSGAVGHGTAGPDGTVYIPKGTCSEAMLFISHDEGATWDGVQVSDTDMAAGEHDAGVGVDAAGNVYYFWIGLDRLPYLAVSRDGGASWGEPFMVGPPGLQQAHLPAAQAAGVGKVAFAYLGSFDAPSLQDASDDSAYAETTWHQMVGLTVDALVDDPTFLTASATPADDPIAVGACNAVRCNNAVKDFIHLEIGPDGTPWVASVDGCIAACARGESMENDGREGAVARLWGGPSLRDA
ncbi:MAG TPA: sialidase family protein [Candidatus Thermoplasmatota archaeon]|nr:sialidase family protein [Candidatus Thermoplasmatota archaeon]